MFKRFFLFFGVNILVVVTVSLLLNLLGVNGYRTYGGGINMQSLLAFCFIWGMAGSFISLMLSKWMAKNLYGLQVIDVNGPYGEIVRIVHHLAKKADIDKMPEVAIYDSPESNAFATGPSKNNSLVAVSTGLLQRMSRDELEGVLGHEVAHIANGDMVTMTLLQGVINAFVMFFARIATFAIDNFLRGNNEEGQGLGFFAHMIVTFVLETVFALLAAPVVAWFSRYREFRADAGSAQLAGRQKMIAALESLRRNYEAMEDSKAPQAVRAMQISSKGSFIQLLSTHPTLEKRIEALKRNGI